MPTFKTPEQAITGLHEVRQVAWGQMTSTIIAPQRAEQTYEKYGNTINSMIGLGQNLVATQKSLQSYAQSVMEEKPGIASYAGMAAGAGALTLFGSIGMVLTAGQIIGPRDIRDTAMGPSEHITESEKVFAKAEAALKQFDQSLGNVQTAYTSLANAIAANDDVKVNQAHKDLGIALDGLKKSVSSVERTLEQAGAYSEATKGMLTVVGTFATEAAITVATMGAMGLVEKGVVYAAKGVVASGEAAETAALLAGNTAAELGGAARIAKAGVTLVESEAVPGVIVAGRTTVKVGKEVYHAEHSAVGLNEELKSDMNAANGNFE
jgi:hypothetical protein